MNLISWNDPRLYRPSDPVTDFSLFRELSSQMTDLMIAERAAGVAAPQVGANVAFFVSKCPSFLVAINPRWCSDVSAGRISKPESSISRRGWSTYVARPAAIHAEWTNPVGMFCQADLSGMDARIFMHLADMLEGRTLWAPPLARQLPLGISGE